VDERPRVTNAIRRVAKRAQSKLDGCDSLDAVELGGFFSVVSLAGIVFAKIVCDANQHALAAALTEHSKRSLKTAPRLGFDS
jgi:hypothetical protein